MGGVGKLFFSDQLFHGIAKHPPFTHTSPWVILEATAPKSLELHFLWTSNCIFPVLVWRTTTVHDYAYAEFMGKRGDLDIEISSFL